MCFTSRCWLLFRQRFYFILRDENAVSSEEVVRETAERYQLWRKQDTIVIAVSGGVDSMVLLYMMHNFAQVEELRLVVAHVNHGYRLEESAKEKQLVEQVAKKLGYPFAYIELEMPQYLVTNKGNAQQLGRERRYQFLFDVASHYQASSIATAHHADDQVETVLQHFIRGSGLSGLSGMAFKRQEKNVQLIRPMLRITKDDIYDYQRKHSVPYLEDSSNKKTDYNRNQIRLEAIPYLEQYNSKFKQAILRVSELSRDEDDYLSQVAQQYVDKLARKDGNSIIIERIKVTELHVALQRRLIKLILNYLSCYMNNLSYESIERVREAIVFPSSTTSKLNVSDNVWCILEYDSVRFIHEVKKDEYNDDKQQIYIPYESTQLSFGHWEISVNISNQKQTITDRFTAIFDAEALCFPLIVRTKQAGDRMHIQGLAGTKKLQDLFVDAKIPSIHRLQYPIICDQERLIWVPGIRKSKYGLVSEKTTSYLIIRAERK